MNSNNIHLEENITTKAGYVAIIGKPNAGKSTLLNQLIGTKLSIVTAKPQTTRKRVLGISTDNNTQIVFLDTPGILKPKYQMQSAMMDYVHNSINEADCIVYIYDVSKYKLGNVFPESINNILENVKKSNKKIILLLNKIDLLPDAKHVLPVMAALNDTNLFAEIIPISALRNSNVNDVILTISKYLPSGPFFYDAELLSTQPERFFVSELIRENIFMLFSEEIPYSTEVSILEFKERTHGKWYINAEIIVEKQSQKGIIIGKDGETLKRLMERSRLAVEKHLQMPVYLEVFVKVRPKWRNNPTYLKSFGYKDG